MDRDRACVLDALIFARRILEFTTGMDEAKFKTNRLEHINRSAYCYI